MATKNQNGKLVFIGLGLHDDEGITLKGLREAQDSETVFAEEYTSMLAQGAFESLEKKIGKSIRLLDRRQTEDGREVLEACRDHKVAFLVAGDPMSATTHVDLRLRAAKSGVRTEIVHGASALTAVPGILGLQHYKFGRTTTIPFPQEGYAPTSPYEVVAMNLGNGLHSLVLLDIDAENSRYMTANEGLHALLDMERRVAKGVIMPQTLVCVVARAGSEDCIARAGPISALISERFGPPLHSVVVPGKLHFMEEDALETLAGKPRG